MKLDTLSALSVNFTFSRKVALERVTAQELAAEGGLFTGSAELSQLAAGAVTLET